MTNHTERSHLAFTLDKIPAMPKEEGDQIRPDQNGNRLL